MEKIKCGKCGCTDFSEKETYGTLCPTQRWLVCDRCSTIVKKIEI